MMYIVPFFSLTGLYWQYGLVLYWVTTNVWTLGQQFVMFRNWAVVPTGKAAVAAAAAATGITGRTTQTSLRSGSGAAKASADGKRSGSGGSGGAKTSAGGARSGSTSTRTSGNAASGNGASGNGSGGAANGSGGARAGAPRRAATVTTPPVQPPIQAPVANGREKRGLRLGRQKQEPVPEPEVPTVKVVRQQPVRQAKGKRSGNKR
jgi:YidC/Oxa1 family membrane protein insertase